LGKGNTKKNNNQKKRYIFDMYLFFRLT